MNFDGKAKRDAPRDLRKRPTEGDPTNPSLGEIRWSALRIRKCQCPRLRNNKEKRDAFSHDSEHVPTESDGGRDHVFGAVRGRGGGKALLRRATKFRPRFFLVAGGGKPAVSPDEGKGNSCRARGNARWIHEMEE